jgi:hypothetical protein
MQNALIVQEFNDLKKAIVLLKASVKKFKAYKPKKVYTPDELEYYDSLSFRFEKSIELLLNFFKALELFTHARLNDTLRDRLLLMRKLKIVDDIDFWIEARLLRNKIAHTYLPNEFKDIYNDIFKKSKVIFETIDKIDKYLIKALKRL